ncbi:MAG: micrococcal nuclease [Caulobacter sp.]|nr:micrococcal nuclease [Caulobacter sp.]
MRVARGLPALTNHRLTPRGWMLLVAPVLTGLMALTAAVLVALQPAPPAQRPPGPNTVTRVVDGDTVDVRMDGRIVRVRLAEIDAPESKQAWGATSKAVLTRLTLNKSVRIEGRGRDRYGRVIGRLYVGEVDVSAAMIQEGCAWAYRRYLTDPTMLALEQDARARKTGLWAQNAAQIVPPWDWRRGGEGPEAAPVAGFVDAGPAQATPAATGAFTCGAARTCGQMKSCEEATFHLRQCGLSRLDRDGDGIPCESLCRPGG